MSLSCVSIHSWCISYHQNHFGCILKVFQPFSASQLLHIHVLNKIIQFLKYLYFPNNNSYSIGPFLSCESMIKLIHSII